MLFRNTTGGDRNREAEYVLEKVIAIALAEDNLGRKSEFWYVIEFICYRLKNKHPALQIMVKERLRKDLQSTQKGVCMRCLMVPEPQRWA
jgi:hypothetical protein